MYRDNLANVTNEGKLKRQSLEAAASRVIKGRIQIGQFDPPAAPALPPTEDSPPWMTLTSDVVFSEAHQRLSLEGAEQSVVLLRNPKSLLPLDVEHGLNVAVVGPNGNEADVFQGQYHGTNCPGSTNWNGSYDCLPTAFTELRRLNPKGNTTYHNGCSLSPSASDGSGHPEGQPCNELEDLDTILAAAEAADVVVLFLGLDIKMTNKEGQDRAHNASGYPLPGKQQELAKFLHEKTSTPIVVVVLSGMAVGMDWIAAEESLALVIGGCES